MLPDYKKEKAQKNSIFFLLNRHSNFIKNSFCHSLTGIPHFRAITTNQRHMHSMFLHCYKHNIQPTYFKVQHFLVLESALSLCYDSMFQVMSPKTTQGDCNKAVHDFIIHLVFCTKTQSNKIKPTYPNSRTLQALHLKFYSKQPSYSVLIKIKRLQQTLTVPTFSTFEKNTTKLFEQTFNCFLLKVFVYIASIKKVKRKIEASVILNYLRTQELVNV